MVADVQDGMNRNYMRTLYPIVNGTRHNTVPVPSMCNDLEENLLTDKTVVAASLKENFQQLFYGVNWYVARNRVNIDIDGWTVDPLTIREVKRAVSELKNCKAAGKNENTSEIFWTQKRAAVPIDPLNTSEDSDEKMPIGLQNGFIAQSAGQNTYCSAPITELLPSWIGVACPLEEFFVGDYQTGDNGPDTHHDIILDKFRE